MNDEGESWNDDLEAYVQAYADEERSAVDAAAAYERFNREQSSLDASPAQWTGRRRVIAFAVVGVALAAGLASVWVMNGQSLQIDHKNSGTLTQDGADPSSAAQTAVPMRLPRAAPEPNAASEGRATVAGEPEILPLEKTLVEPRPRAQARQVRGPSADAPPIGPPPAQPSVLARELAMLSALREAVRSREYADALKRVRTHRAQFPKPRLAAERDLIEIEALCGLGRTSQAQEAKGAFAKTHPTHHLRAKAELVCEKRSEGAQNEAPLRHQEK